MKIEFESEEELAAFVMFTHGQDIDHLDLEHDTGTNKEEKIAEILLELGKWGMKKAEAKSK